MIINRLKDILKANINSKLEELKGSDFDEWKNFFDKDEHDSDFYKEENFEEEFKSWERENTSYTNTNSNQINKENEYYADLELKRGATFKEIKASYRRLIKMYHPDLFQHDEKKKKIADEVTLKINEAYDYFDKQFNKRN